MQPEVDQTLSPEIGFKPQNEQVINSAIQEFMKTPMTRRKFLTVALGTAAMALAGCGEKDDGLVDSADESSTKVRPAFTPNFDLKTTPTPESTATPTEVLPTATSTPEPTATFTPEPTATFTPEPTATPTEVPPTATPEALRFNGTIPFEIVTNTPEFYPFDRMEPNPEYPDAEATIQYLALRSLTQLKYAMENPVNLEPDVNTLNNPDVEGLKQQMLTENVEFLVPGHPPENMDKSAPVQMVTVRPDQGIRLEIAVDSSQITSVLKPYEGTLNITTGSQFRFGVDSNGKSILRIIYDEKELDLEKMYAIISPLHVLGDLRAGLELFRFRHKMTGQVPDVLPLEHSDPEIMDTLFINTDKPADNENIYYYPERGSNVFPLLKFTKR
jgi:hypothetical protein